jgi:predicted metal-dependent phosphoesterase TrpH
MKVDLHIHSNFSDGKYSPSKIVEYAVRSQLDVISLTDHDTIDGIREAKKAIQQFNSIGLISGVEFSTCQDNDELHILGYGIDETHSGLVQLLEIAQTNRKKRISRILKKLRTIGIHINVEDVKNGFRAVSLGRMHVAHVLINRGYAQTVREAFDRYLGYDARVIERSGTDFMSSYCVVKAILDAGGIPVFAHPTIELFDRHIDALTEYGLRGVEVFKEKRPSIEEFYLETVVKDKGLFLTGGSDWHGYRATRSLGSFYVNSARIQPFLEAVHVV